MKSKNNKGFTIVELMLGIVISSILAITAGMMLYYSSLSWHRNSNAVELQRDATFAMDMLSRAIRPATDLQIQVSGAMLTIGNKSFYLTGNDLVYNVGGVETEIVKDKVTTLSFTKNSSQHSVSINMVLQHGTETITLNPLITYRN